MVLNQKIASFGTWKSPFTPELLTQGVKLFHDVVVDDQDIYWLEGRPDEKGRSVIVKYKQDNSWSDVTPTFFNVRTRVHEYGGGSFTVYKGVIYFVNDQDQRIYVQDGVQAEPKPLTAEGNRYAHLLASQYGLIAVAEEHRGDAVNNWLARIDYQTGDSHVLVSGGDFYAYPSLHPDETKLAWITWDHPNMPWDNTELYVADFDGYKLSNIQKKMGNGKESIVEPRWSPTKELYVISDRSNWWNLYKVDEDRSNHAAHAANIVPVLNIDAEFATPTWVHGISNWCFLNQQKIIAQYIQAGIGYLTLIDVETQTKQDLDVSGVAFAQIKSPHLSSLSSRSLTLPFAVMIKSYANKHSEIVKIDVDNLQGSIQESILSRPEENKLADGYISQAQAIEFPSQDKRTSQGLYYAPTNQDFIGPENTLPPLIVKSHGGPTAMACGGFDPKIQFWTSRGFAVVDVNYGGSTGFGRSYRELLKDNWGVVDREDCEAAATYLVEKKLVDPNYLFIRGGSAGGFTTLCALTFGQRFTAGASYYGVSDLLSLREETHKFESRYLDKLVGSYPEKKSLYQARSPIYHTEDLNAPIIFFQGEEDTIVPPNQAQEMANALKKQGIKHELVLYKNEQHGFRQAETIQDSLLKELAFYKSFFVV